MAPQAKLMIYVGKNGNKIGVVENRINLCKITGNEYHDKKFLNPD